MRFEALQVQFQVELVVRCDRWRTLETFHKHISEVSASGFKNGGQAFGIIFLSQT